MLGDAVRLVYYANREETVHGRMYRREITHRAWWQKALGIRYEEGTHTDFAPLTRIEALTAFNILCAGGGIFALETKEGTRIDFLKQGRDWIALDIWSVDVEIEDGALSMSNVQALIGLIFDTDSDQQIADFIQGCYKS